MVRSSGLARNLALAVFLLQAVTGLAVGLALLLIRTPADHAGDLKTASRAYYETALRDGLAQETDMYLLDLARQTALQALSYTPYDPQLFSHIARIESARAGRDAPGGPGGDDVDPGMIGPQARLRATSFRRNLITSRFDDGSLGL